MKRLLLFAPAFYNWAETHRMASIALKIKEMDYSIAFLGRGRYDYLCVQNGFYQYPIDGDQEWLTPDRIEKIMKMDLYGNDYASEHELETIVNSEISILKDINPAAVITGYRTTLHISCKASKIPLIWVLSSVISPMYYEEGLASMPMNEPIHFVKNITDKVKQNQMYSKIARSNNSKSKIWNSVLKAKGLPEINSNLEVFQGDYNIMSDAIELFNGTAFQKNKNYVFSGPILNREVIPMPESVRDMTEINQPKVFLSMGSSGDKELFHRILSWIKKMPYLFIAASSSIFDYHAIEHADNVIIESKFPHMEICELCDACIIHGGQGTIYATIMSGRPYLGIPMFSEQQYNLENLQKFHAGLILSMQETNENTFSEKLTEIIHNKAYREHAEKLSKKLQHYQKPEHYGELTAAQEIDRFLKNYV